MKENPAGTKKHFLKFLALETGRDRFWFIIRFLACTFFLILFLKNPSLYSKTTATGLHLAKKKLLLVFFSYIAFWLFPSIRAIARAPKWLQVILVPAEVFLSVLMTLIMCEQIHEVHYLQMRTVPMRFNFWLVFALFVFFFAVTGLLKISLFLTYFLVNLFSAANYFVYQFRGDPINPADMFVLGTAMEVADSYTLTLTPAILQTILGGILLAAVLGALPRVPHPRWKLRLVCTAAGLVFSCWTFHLFAFTRYPEGKGTSFIWFNAMKRYQTAGEVLFFVHGFYSISVKTPDGYSASSFEKWIQESGYESDSAALDPGVQAPNLIFIMNEGLFDFTVYDAVEPSEDPFAFIHSLKGQSNTILGNLHVDVFGGQTANTEYEVLTGTSIAFLPPTATAYVLFVQDVQPSLTWNLRDMGYTGNIAFHPYTRNNYNRPRAYEYLGFEEFVALDTINDQVTPKDYLRNRFSDSSDFRFLTQLYEKARAESPAPFYLYNVTMQNHGPFDADFDNFPMPISLTGTLEKDDQAERYINLAHYTDMAFRELTDYFSKVTEPTVLVMYGDHQPKLHTSTYKKLYGKSIADLEGEDIFQRYETPLIIWANFDINPGHVHDSLFQDISVNYLSAALTKTLGLPMTAAQKFLMNMNEQLPVFTMQGYLDREGTYYQTTDTSSPYYQDWILLYNKIVYNYQFDKKKRISSFFTLKD